MCAMQRNFPQQTQPPQPPQPPNQEPEDRFRWELYLGIPITVGLFIWFLHGMKIDFKFLDIATFLAVVNEQRFLFLVGLGVLCVTVLCIIKALRKH